MLTVVCAYVRGNGFTDDYVYRLRDGVKQHCQAEHNFVCLTNERINVDCVKPRGKNKGWWIKLHLFSAFTGPTVYFDLDTMIVGDVTDICTYPHRFTGLTGFKLGKFASGFMAWNGDYSYLDMDITPTMLSDYNIIRDGWTKYGDQTCIAYHLKTKPDLTDELFPGRFVSYKWAVRGNGCVPAGASVVCFHGKPRPADVNWSLPSDNRNKQ